MLKGLLGLSSNIFACVGVSISARAYICGEQNTSVLHEQAFSERVFKDTGVSQDPVRGSGNASVDVSLSSVPPFLSDGFIRLGNECRVPSTENLAPRPPGGFTADLRRAPRCEVEPCIISSPFTHLPSKLSSVLAV